MTTHECGRRCNINPSRRRVFHIRIRFGRIVQPYALMERRQLRQRKPKRGYWVKPGPRVNTYSPPYIPFQSERWCISSSATCSINLNFRLITSLFTAHSGNSSTHWESSSFFIRTTDLRIRMSRRTVWVPIGRDVFHEKKMQPGRKRTEKNQNHE